MKRGIGLSAREIVEKMVLKTNICPWKANTSAIAPSGGEQGTYLRKYSQLVNLQHVYQHGTFKHQLSTCMTIA
jgi:hypothetical protein